MLYASSWTYVPAWTFFLTEPPFPPGTSDTFGVRAVAMAPSYNRSVYPMNLPGRRSRADDQRELLWRGAPVLHIEEGSEDESFIVLPANRPLMLPPP